MKSFLLSSSSDSDSPNSVKSKLKEIAPAVIGVTGVLAIGFAVSRYRVSEASQFVVRTGPLIEGISISKKAFQWPFQTASILEMAPSNYSFNLQAMSREKMEFIIPGVFTIGPRNDVHALEKYALLLGNEDHKKIDSIIEGVIEGETRVLAASMNIEEIFNGRDKFKATIIDKVQDELDQFGLVIYNANVKELQDMQGSEYFKHMRQKTRAGAENQARIEIANAKYLGDVGEKEKQRDTRIQSADFESLAVQKENERAIEMAKSTAELKVEQAQADRKTSIAQIETEMAAEMRRSELQKDVETRNIAQQTEKMRSELLVKAVVESEAIERRAEADLVKKKKEGEGLLFYKQCEAEGLLATFNAQSEGLKKLLQAHPDPMVALQYMMIDRDVFTKLSDSNAKAIQGLQPKITHWVTGKDGSDPMGQIFKNLPPMIETIYNQTGVRPPNWLMNTDQLVQQPQPALVETPKNAWTRPSQKKD